MGEGRGNECYFVKVFPACPVYPSDKSDMKVKKLKLCIAWKK